MRTTLKKYFIPHEGNDHRPHLLRWEGMLALVSFTLVVEIFFLAQLWVLTRHPEFLASILNSALVQDTNAERIASAEIPLRVSPLLEKAARLKAEDMAAKGYFAHVSPEGTTPWYWFGKAGYEYARAGENLAVNFTDSADVVAAWLASPSHRANLLNGAYSEIGIGLAQGIYKGRETVFIVQMFGTPSRQTPRVSDREAITGAAAQKPLPPPVPEPSRTSSVAGAESDSAGANPDSAGAETGKAELASPATDPDNHYAEAPFWARTAANPRGSVSLVYVTLATIVALALLFLIFVRMKIHHPALVVNGVVFMLLIGSVLLVNRFVALTGAAIV